MSEPQEDQIAPRMPIRRFDVFAEVNRRKALAEGKPEDEAKGYGIWLAKVVAGRRFGASSSVKDRRQERERREEGRPPEPEPKFRHAGDELQTDETFDREIIERMGPRFYDLVFAPAIEQALARGEKYEQFRDAIRTGWKPARATARGNA
jgi:hypothetical protein